MKKQATKDLKVRNGGAVKKQATKTKRTTKDLQPRTASKVKGGTLSDIMISQHDNPKPILQNLHS
jgi:hypothetical protein